MYSLVALLAIPVTACFLKAYALDAESDNPRRPWIAGFARLAGGLRCTRITGRSSSRSPRVVAFLVLLALSAARSELLRDGLLGFGGAFVLYLPWMPTTLYQAAHTGAPWSDAPALQRCWAFPASLLGRMPEIVLLICAGAGRGRCWQRGRPARRARARARSCSLIIAVGTPALAWLMSQASPAWANRYLAVALAPFMLLAAGGLAYAGRLGLVGLLLVVIMWAQDNAPVEKSNVRAVADGDRRRACSPATS